MIETSLVMAAAAIVGYRIIVVISLLDRHKFPGQPWRFCAIAMHAALMGAGSLAVAIGSPLGGPLLLCAVSLMILADRRRIR